MNASKENAQKALAALDKLWRSHSDVTSNEIDFIADFLRAAEKKLPWERTYEEAKKSKSSRKAAMNNVTLEDV